MSEESGVKIMLCFQVEAEIVDVPGIIERNTDGTEDTDDMKRKHRARKMEFEDTSEWKNFKEFSFHYSEELYEKSGRKVFVFAVGVKGSTILNQKVLLGITSRKDRDVANYAVEFLKHIDVKFKNIVVSEITFKSIDSLLRKSAKNSLISDHEDVLELFGLIEISERHRWEYAIDFHEDVLDENVQKRDLINKASALLCDETLIPEIERIFQMPSQGNKIVHPVQYAIQASDTLVQEQISAILLSALYANNRIRSRRFCTIGFNEDSRLPDVYNALYRSCAGSTVIVNLRTAFADNDEYAKPDIDLIAGICEAIKKHKDVLTILLLPYSCEKTKRLVAENLGSVTLVTLHEELAFGEKAKKYLRGLAKAQEVSSDKMLYQSIADNKGYLSSDLDIMFEEWYAKKLKTKIFPQYATFESSSSQVARNKPRGSAFTDLEKMIGLPEVKKVISQAIDYHKAQKLFKDKGISSEKTARHMVFTGNPGTAKTTAARLFAQIMKENNLLSEGKLYEVGRADLVGKYVGWTARIVKNKFEQARGSVLFIDEAYSLVDDKDGLFGDEAINTIVQEMENNREDMVVIFAGYPDKMEQFLQKNPGLRSRIAFNVPFEDYTPDELYEITKLLADNKELILTPDVEEKLLPIFEIHSKQDDFGNGRFARNLLEKALMKQASRLLTLDPSNVSKDDVLTLTAEDFDEPELPTMQKQTIGFTA